MRGPQIPYVVFALALVVLFLSPTAVGEGPSADGLWRPLRAVPAGTTLRIEPEKCCTFTLDRGRMNAALRRAPSGDADMPSVQAGEQISLPMPDGTYKRFRIVKAPVMAPKLAEQYPDIQTYRGVCVADPSTCMRLTMTPLGACARVRLPEGTACIDPLSLSDAKLHASYFRRDAGPEGDFFECLADGDSHTGGSGAGASGPLAGLIPFTSGVDQRTYRLAITTTGGYTTWANANAGSVMAAVTTTVNNVNLIMETQVALTLQLIGNTNLLFYTDATDPYSDPATLDEVHAQITAVIGSPNFDIGHCFDQPGGGVATRGSVCDDARKGRGYSGATDPATAFFEIRVSHEMGHQFNCPHTWNSPNFAPGQWSATSAWEPGAGTTIMSYGHGGGADQLTGRDDYYHAGSIDQIVTFTTVGGGSCGAAAATGNAPPTVSAGVDRTIPLQTPFILTATGNDVDGDPLDYGWWQYDAASATAFLTTLDNGSIPLFRAFRPGTDPTRTFPSLQVLIDNDLFPATTTPGVLGEQLPRTNRVLTFIASAHDGLGGVTTDSMSVTVDDGSGPFEVASPNGAEIWDAALGQVVTWDVAGTDGPPVSTANVNILLSQDGGYTYPFTLATNTPNDGTQAVTLPACQLSTTCRIKVESAGNVYFDISDADFEIADLTPPVVSCSVLRPLLWPPRNGMLPVALGYMATDDCDGAPTVTLSVYSNEANGPAPYTPDASLVGSNLRLRAQRNYPGPGRVYLVVVEATDASANATVACCTVVVPTLPFGSYLLGLYGDAAVAEAWCLANGNVPPPGWSPLVAGAPLP